LTGTRPPSRANAARKTRRTNQRGRTGSRRVWRLGWRGWLILTSSTAVLALFAWAAVARQLAPTSNTSLTHFDAIIVLGAPADTDGNPSPVQLARVTEAVHEYERGVAPRIIVSGGIDRNRPVEAQVMARTAKAQGIPASAVFEEGKARDTIENGCYSVGIMQSHGWHSAEVVSSANHLPRVGLIFSELPVEWRTHAAPPLEHESMLRWGGLAASETLKTLRYLAWARWMDNCKP
jgi:uncharacterized SAM-binding protein YcdF (DUF218 family)